MPKIEMIQSKCQVGIIIPQWNGAADTIDCLQSLLPALQNIKARLVVIDNGSSDDSVVRLRQFWRANQIAFSECYYTGREFQPSLPMQATDITLLWQMENAGFAGACNLGLRYLGLESCDWFLLLNNDTIVRHDFLEQMLAQAEHAPQIEVWAPVITYFHNPNLIWDVGGDLTWWGDRTFPGRKKLRSKYPTRGFTQRSFLTGCALLVKSSLFRELGLLTEQFFFGEEDYWFARHLQQHRRQLAVCWAAEIRHKVATSIRKVSPNSSIPLVYIHNLNRLIDMRTWLKPPCYLLWELVYLPYACFRLWWKNWVPLPVLLRFIRLLLETTRYKTEVTRTDFFQARKRFK